ncbi:MAG: hypothetical protein IKP58_16155 [Victivallales bacterium]|nr:hypothetical protein [Victivallales bacterium]
MKCPHCQKEISGDALACPYCWKDIPRENNVVSNCEEHRTGETSKFSEPSIEETNNEKYKTVKLMTSGEKLLTWIAIIFIPLGIPATCYIYYKWNNINPQKAAQLNKHSWAAFFVALIIRGGIYSNSFWDEEPDNNVSVEESIDLREKNNKSEDDARNLSEVIDQYRKMVSQGWHTGA